MKPDSSTHDPRPEYLRALLDQAGLSQRAAARVLGISERMMREYVQQEHKLSKRVRRAPYLVQFALECLAADVLER